MPPATTRSCWFLIGALALAPAAAGHGGNNPMPPPPPPPNPQGDVVRRTNAPTTPGGNRPTTGGAPSTPTTGGSRGAGPTTGRRRPTEAFDRWEFWWESNQHGYLLVDPRRDPRPATRGPSGSESEGAPTEVAPEVVRARILPALLAALSDPEAEVADSAALALARIVRPQEANLVLEPLRRALDHPEKSVRESATLALGVLGDPDALPTLTALLLDTEEGRRLTAHPAGVEERVRAFAAAALGRLGEGAALGALEQAFDAAAGGASRDVAQLALLAAGMVHGRAVPQVSFLLRAMERRDLDPIVRAQAPIALALVAATPEGAGAARAALAALVAALGDEKNNADLRRSAAIALGRIARAEERDALAALEQAAQRSTDAPTRQLALIAIAEIGARDTEARDHATVHQGIERFLLQELIEPAHASQRPFAALALGIWGRNPAVMPDARERAIAQLLATLKTSSQGSQRAAMALALGLLDSREAIEPLAATFGATREATLKGYGALALGLLRARGETAALITEFERRGIAPLVEVQLARALSLLADPRALPLFLERLQCAGTFAEVAAVARALGVLRLPGAVDPLLALLGDPKAPAARRAIAIAALGQLAEKERLPWFVPFLAGSNYCARGDALVEIADLF